MTAGDAQALLELLGCIIVLCALVPPLSSLFNRRSDEVDLRPPLQRTPKRYRDRLKAHESTKQTKLNPKD